MKFGLFIIGDDDPELKLDLKGYYERMLEQVRWGESLGYECFWFGEHHFDFHGVIPSPTVLMSAAATCTDSIRLGVAVALLPYRDPILTAEEYAMIDVLSGGRLDFGVGRGTPPELVGFGVKEDNRDLLVESLEVVEMAWREGRVSYHGKFHDIDDVSLNVLPVQRPVPPVYFAALSQGSYQVAGERGYPILGIPFASCKDMAEVKRKVSFYKEVLSENGHDPAALDVGQTIHTHVAESDAAARGRARPAMKRYYEARKAVRPRGYDELDRGRMLMVGGPGRCIEQIQEIADTGANYVIFSMNFAGLDQKSILESMAMMAEEVLPRIESRR
ncbi:MAG: LLM class flavin-dependent oxidoreductase [Deltaproteobacteria bacterium]|nr:LLM class flavin-dependent oxidoreductase [Deltaproteobacteria bacterium]